MRTAASASPRVLTLSREGGVEREAGEGDELGLRGSTLAGTPEEGALRRTSGMRHLRTALPRFPIDTFLWRTVSLTPVSACSCLSPSLLLSLLLSLPGLARGGQCVLCKATLGLQIAGQMLSGAPPG